LEHIRRNSVFKTGKINLKKEYITKKGLIGEKQILHPFYDSPSILPVEIIEDSLGEEGQSFFQKLDLAN
jgi:hypothetical protein